jgi:hypothetical protein
MPYIDGFQLSKRVLDSDINVKICFMSAGEINRDALREIHPSISLGCFIKNQLQSIIWLEGLFRNWISIINPKANLDSC